MVKDFVAVLKNDHQRTNNKHWFICLDCYRDDTWQTRISRKVITTKAPPKKRPSIDSDFWDAMLKGNIARNTEDW